MHGPRAVAVVVRDRRVLVIKRHVSYLDQPNYAVLPGGSIDDGETFEEAAVRELWEEATMSATVAHELLRGKHNGREARYFVMTDVEGEPVLGGAELSDHGPDNGFEFVWASAADLGVLGLHPAHLRVDLPRLLGLRAT